MSKIGKLPVSIPEGVTVQLSQNRIEVSGPKGDLSFTFRPEVDIAVEDSTIKVARRQETKFAKSLHGLTRSLVANMVKGVSQGHEKVLELIGVGYRASIQGENLLLSVGFSHPVLIKRIKGVDFEIKDNKIIISGADKSLVGEIAASIKRVRPPEPYKGKGIKYLDELVRRKAGKTLKTATGA